ncbi:MAG TPA: pitrilysin family protein [Candidatus Limnocylindria bacterium]|nr:pitrilysin family protein [Candidatus Limnocylindria bacterium]
MPHIPSQRHRLDNGLRVVLSPDDRAPIVAVNLWYDVGSKHERPGRTGFAHLFEHMMFQGSEHVAKGEHFALIQAAGGTLNASTWLDRTNYFETLPSHELELGLWLESDRLASLLPAMTQEKLDNQREVVKNERRWSVDNQPYGTWDEKVQELLYPQSHPYHHSTIGSMEDLDAASLEDVREFFATYYAPNNAVLTVAGDFEPDAALAMIDRHFGPIPPNPALPPAPDVTVEPRLGTELRETVRDMCSLPRVYLGHRMPVFGTDEFDALLVAADLLGAGRAARLYRVLVRERKLAQDVSVFPFPVVGGASMFTLWATARPGVEPGQLESAMVVEIDRLAADGPSDAELERVRNLHAAAVESGLERVSERADRLSMYTCLFDEPDRINTEVSRYLEVSSDRIRRAMAATLRADNRLSLTYLPADAALASATGAEEAAR